MLGSTLTRDKQGWASTDRTSIARGKVVQSGTCACEGGSSTPNVVAELARDHSGETSCRSGIGRPAKSRRQGCAIRRAQRADRLTLALSVAMPVLAYICR
jgi:hypothetical protein